MTATYRNPAPTVDILIEAPESSATEPRVYLISRKNPPLGWAIPGGFIDYGESAEAAAIREALEETSLVVELVAQFAVYSDPSRDLRQHTMSVVFVARAVAGEPRAEDDAAEIAHFSEADLPDTICFDHRQILNDFFTYRRTHKRPLLTSPTSA